MNLTKSFPRSAMVERNPAFPFILEQQDIDRERVRDREREEGGVGQTVVVTALDIAGIVCRNRRSQDEL